MLFQGETQTEPTSTEEFGYVVLRQQLEDNDEFFSRGTNMVLVQDLLAGSPRYCWYDFNEALEDDRRNAFFNVAVFSSQEECNEALGDMLMEWGPKALTGCRLWTESVVMDTIPERRRIVRQGLRLQVERHLP